MLKIDWAKRDPGVSLRICALRCPHGMSITIALKTPYLQPIALHDVYFVPTQCPYLAGIALVFRFAVPVTGSFIGISPITPRNAHNRVRSARMRSRRADAGS